MLDDALALASRGWPVFPCHNAPNDEMDKKPLNHKGFKGATLKTRPIEILWRSDPTALIGVALPLGTMALDVDDVKKFEAVGLDVPDAPMQRTRSGGYHMLYATDGRPVRQTVKEIPGADTRVGGKGYVVAWEPDAFPTPDDLPAAPEWLYDPDGESETEPEDAQPPRDGHVEVALFRKGSRDNDMASFAGTMRRLGAGPDAIFAALSAMLDNGQIEQGSGRDKITARDLKRIAGSIGKLSSDAVDKQRRPKPIRHFATSILKNEYSPINYFIEELLPEGFGIIAGPPKVGKSWLILQAGIEIATGGALLDRPAVEARPVLYYSLEDGERRIQDRLEILIGARDLDLGWLEFRFEAPQIGSGLEEDIGSWLDTNGTGLVIVDVLAKVRPAAAGRGSAYDEDYTTLEPLHKVAKLHPGSGVVIISHLRKAGSDDFLAMVQGTTGVTASADYTWVVKRDRGVPKGTIQVTGRDIKYEPFVEALFNGAWSAVATTRRGGTKQRNHILDALRTEGDSTAHEITTFVNDEVITPEDTPFTRTGVNQKLVAMEEAGLVEQTDVYVAGKNGGYKWRYVDEAQHEAEDAASRTAASVATRDSDAARTISVRRVPSRGGASGRAGRPAMPPSQAPQAPQASEPREGEEPTESEEGVPGGRPRNAPARPRAPAHTRGVS